MAMRSTRAAMCAALLSMGAAGCQLIADFDRSKIPTDAGSLPDASGFDAGLDAQLGDAALDAALDAELPFDAGRDAAQDAGPEAGPLDDAGDDDAGDDDAG